ncbi:MAG: dihydrodipicolinate synthase family protein [Planctomycetaceae bacterium]|nr:dihydrodipicolinate synthase family protein [Planctomycetaceae bacterium]
MTQLENKSQPGTLPFPRLWCPPLTHYKPNGEIDAARITAHWQFMKPHVNAFLVPGSTGDVWEMDDAEIKAVLSLSLELAQKQGSQLLLGALKPDASSTLNCIEEMLSQLKAFSGKQDSQEAMLACNVVGFVICPPRGKEISEQEMESAIRSVLNLGLPTAVYQLPQVTENEMPAELVSRLSEAYPNLKLLKDSSGEDKVANEIHANTPLFLVRGAEGNYANWLQETGGPYRGLLLSTANSFPSQLRKIVDSLEAGEIDKAQEISDQLTSVVARAFDLVASLPDGNAFANANKAFDHFMAWGDAAHSAPLPRLHAGSSLPEEIIHQVENILQQADLLPSQGYLSTHSG